MKTKKSIFHNYYLQKTVIQVDIPIKNDDLLNNFTQKEKTGKKKFMNSKEKERKKINIEE